MKKGKQSYGLLIDDWLIHNIEQMNRKRHFTTVSANFVEIEESNSQFNKTFIMTVLRYLID